MTAFLSDDDVKAMSGLHTIEQLRALPDAEKHQGPGVYFLWNADALAYVGTAIHVAYRIHQHGLVRIGRMAGKRIAFTHATVLQASHDDRHELESRYIGRHWPPFNERGPRT